MTAAILDFSVYALVGLLFYLCVWLLEGAVMVWRLLTGRKA